MKPKTFSPILTAKGVRLAIAVGRFNERVTKLLLEGALEAYARLGGTLPRSWWPGCRVPLSSPSSPSAWPRGPTWMRWWPWGPWFGGNPPL